ncbi:STAS domain-containing protein [Phenylobacterium sp. LjRoot225]|uniref:STAS domain-containing protein n=1 Tax=Phenylobacterium sp. LjRoot225 TaxID=3342285 RepID=UPI003ECDD016
MNRSVREREQSLSVTLNWSGLSVTSASVGVATIEFVGELTIRTVASCRERLVESLSASPTVQALVAADATVDLTFVQLLESARRTAREAGAAFALAEPATGQLRETLERGGFLASADDRNFWLMQAEGR